MELSELEKREVVLGEVEFRFRKLPPFDAHHVMELIRVAVGSKWDQIQTQGDAAKVILSLVGAVSVKDMEAIRGELFKSVRFAYTGQPQAEMPLVGFEDKAFGDIDPVLIYEVVLRALAVNFSQSISVIQSRLPQEAMDSLQQSTAT